MIRKQSINTDLRSQVSEHPTLNSPLLTSEAHDQSHQSDRKRYNIISEELRKQIIQKLTQEKKSIKEVSKEFGLKLSTCKAILQVYLKEGRIGKKTTRDRKSKIINTLLIATINPLNPLQSTLTPFVQIQEYKCSQKNQEENDVQQNLVTEAIQKAAQHFQGVFDSNSGDGNNVTIPQDSLNMLQNVFMQTQMQTLNQFLLSQSQQIEKTTQNLFSLNNNNSNFLNKFGINTNALDDFGSEQQITANNNLNTSGFQDAKNEEEDEEEEETCQQEQVKQEEEGLQDQLQDEKKEEDKEENESLEEQEEDDIDNEIVESIHKKIFQEKGGYIRKNSIIIQKQSEDLSNNNINHI